jgi:hypothetical protein
MSARTLLILLFTLGFGLLSILVSTDWYLYKVCRKHDHQAIPCAVEALGMHLFADVQRGR